MKLVNYALLLLLPTICQAELLTLVEDSAVNGKVSTWSAAKIDDQVDYDQRFADTNASNLTATTGAQVSVDGATAMSVGLAKMNKFGSTNTSRKITAAVTVSNMADVKLTDKDANAYGGGQANGNGEYQHSGVAASDEIWVQGSFNFKAVYTSGVGNGVPFMKAKIRMVCGPNTITCDYDPIGRRWKVTGTLVDAAGASQALNEWRIGNELDYVVQFQSYVDQTGFLVADRNISADVNVSGVELQSAASNAPSLGIPSVFESIKVTGIVNFEVDDEDPVD